jgi:hypothetical protein
MEARQEQRARFGGKKGPSPNLDLLRPSVALRGILALVLASLAVPALVLNLLLLPDDATREALLAGKNIDEAALSRFYDSRARVEAFHATKDVLSDLALASIQKAEAAGVQTEAGKAAINEARAWQLRALQASPADAFGWSRLVYLFLLSNDAMATLAPQALAYEIETAPYEPALMVRRLGTALYLSDKLDPDIRATLPDMMRAAWKLYPDEVEKVAKAQNAFDRLLEALRASPDTAELLKKWRGL